MGFRVLGIKAYSAKKSGKRKVKLSEYYYMIRTQKFKGWVFAGLRGTHVWYRPFRDASVVCVGVHVFKGLQTIGR